MTLNTVSLVLDLYDGTQSPITTGAATFRPNVQVKDATERTGSAAYLQATNEHTAGAVSAVVLTGSEYFCAKRPTASLRPQLSASGTNKSAQRQTWFFKMMGDEDEPAQNLLASIRKDVLALTPRAVSERSSVQLVRGHAPHRGVETSAPTEGMRVGEAAKSP